APTSASRPAPAAGSPVGTPSGPLNVAVDNPSMPEQAPETPQAAHHAASGEWPEPSSLEEVAELAGRMRDAKLRIDIEEYVGLVKFEPGRIEINLLPGAPASLAGEMSDKLGKWTGRRWIVALAREPGAPPIGVVRREREAAERERLKQHPVLKAVLDVFPDADIKTIRQRDRKESNGQ
ncbi:MAG: DNA polymerase III subunit gamma/tau, partial [Hyphomicrobiaceae bacterium]